VGSNPTPSAIFLCKSRTSPDTYVAPVSLLVAAFNLPKLQRWRRFVALMAFSRNNNPVRFRVRKDAARADSPWVCDFHAHGKRIRKFFPTEELAWVEGAKLTTQVEAKGVESLAADKSGLTVAAAVRMFVNEADPQSNSHRQKLQIFQRAFPGGLSRLCWRHRAGGSPQVDQGPLGQWQHSGHVLSLLQNVLCLPQEQSPHCR
jgi:hypothetical protein